MKILNLLPRRNNRSNKKQRRSRKFNQLLQRKRKNKSILFTGEKKSKVIRLSKDACESLELYRKLLKKEYINISKKPKNFENILNKDSFIVETALYTALALEFGIPTSEKSK